MHPAPGNPDPLSLLSEAAAGRLGLLICGHGSRNRLAVAEFAELAGALRQRMRPLPLEYGYLEFAQPILRDGLEALRAWNTSWRCRRCCSLQVMPKTTSPRY